MSTAFLSFSLMNTKEPKSFTKILSSTSPEADEMRPVLLQLLTEVHDREWEYWEIKLPELPAYQQIKTQDSAYKGRLVLAAAEALQSLSNNYQTRHTLEALLKLLLRSSVTLNDADYLRLFHLYGLTLKDPHPGIVARALNRFPVLATFTQLAKHAQKQPVDEALRTYLRQLLQITMANREDATLRKLQRHLQELLEDDTQALPTVLFTTQDVFGQALNEFVHHLEPETARSWLRLLQLWQTTTGSQPTAKFTKESKTAIEAIGPHVVQEHFTGWLSSLAKLPVQQFARTMDFTHTYTDVNFLSETSLVVAKGLIWSSRSLLHGPLLQALGELALKCYRKTPGWGALAPTLGNACVSALAQGGLPGVAHLSRLRLKVKQASSQTLIQQAIEKASQELGVSPAEIEDMAVPTYDLLAGQGGYSLGEYQATLQLVAGKADVHWTKAGKSLKAAPAALKQTHAAELKELKNTQTQAQQSLAAQRERLDRGFIEARRMPVAWFRQYYVEHGLMSYFTHQLIWRFHAPDGSHLDALWFEGAWRDVQGQAIGELTEAMQVQLWHPVLATSAEVLAWRQLLEVRQLRQPLKQAYREVYVLTPPEERTGTYSNRMAAHVLRQHQFSSLAKVRGWRYKLQGAFDNGEESAMAKLDLPTYNLQAQFWVSEVNADQAWNETGIWLYVSTDQVRFVTGHGPVPLPDIPPIVFSEVMRDVDLFVGVASVGNDPLWRDNGGLPAYRTYWESYSFGELSEVAKNRKLALERLVPRLKIGKVSTLTERFLVVRGKRRTYKIHLGSGNILMEPNDQYLCIVPDRSVKNNDTAGVFLPFEGDAVLSIIVSKALLLMNDDQITDETINRQIKR